MIKYLLFLGIEVYQRTISPDHGVFNRLFPNGYCRFYPSCSEFTKKALLKHGALKGSCMGFRRILRCNPWSKVSIDEVP